MAMNLPEWEPVDMPAGVTSEPGVARALRCARTNCGRVTIVAAKAVETRAGESAPCFHCFRANKLPDRQGTLL